MTSAGGQSTPPVSDDEGQASTPHERSIPASTTIGRRTPTFTAATVPPGLLAAHHTTVWAKLVVTAGSVRFADEEPPWKTTATAGRPVVIVPNRAHHIEPSADAEFHVQFFDFPEGDSDDSTEPSESG